MPLLFRIDSVIIHADDTGRVLEAFCSSILYETNVSYYLCIFLLPLASILLQSIDHQSPI